MNVHLNKWPYSEVMVKKTDKANDAQERQMFQPLARHSYSQNAFKLEVLKYVTFYKSS